MKTTLRLIFLTMLSLALLPSLLLRAAQTQSEREVFLADAGWKFFIGDPTGAEAAGFSDSSWRTIDLPHDWSIEGAPDKKNPTASGGGFFPAGIGWYRKSFIAPDSWKNKHVEVEFEGVASNATVYLNGHKLGFHPYEYTSFHFDLTPELNFGQTNILAVRVDDSEQPSSRWYSGSGIYRHVHLIVTDPVHIAPWGVFVTTPEATPSAAKVVVKTVVRNENELDTSGDVSLITSIVGPSGVRLKPSETKLTVPAGKETETTQELSIFRPSLWSPQHPALYRAVTQVLSGGKIIDRVETTFGVRSLSWSAEKGLLLNDESIKLAGGSVHHDNGPLGAAAFDRAEIRKAQLLKEAGFNAVRTAHNPPSPEFLDACDRLGLLVLEDAFDVWTTPKVKYDYARYFEDWWQRDIDSMVLRDRNHPSIVFWGIGNEIPEAWTPAGAPIAKDLAARIRALDTSRPLTEAFPGATYTPSVDAVAAQLDVMGYNYNIEQNQAKDHERVPGRIMMTTESMPNHVFEEWKIAHEHPYILGEFVWTAMDYLGESGIGSWSAVTPEQAKQGEAISNMMKGAMSNMGANGKNPFAAMAAQTDAKPNPTMSFLFPGYPWHAADSGDIDLTGYRKPQSYYRDIIWNRGDRVYATVRFPEPEGKQIIAMGWAVYPSLPSWTWPGQESKPLTVDVYSGTESVRLYLNDKLIGEKPTGETEKFKATFEVPYAPGTLKVEGVRARHVVAEDQISTTDAPAVLKLTPDRTELSANGEDLAYAIVESLDKEGRLAINDDRQVHFELTGPGSIAGVGSADQRSTGSYQSNTCKLFHGRALAIVRTSGTSGSIRLTVTGDGLSSSTIELTAHHAPAMAQLN